MGHGDLLVTHDSSNGARPGSPPNRRSSAHAKRLPPQAASFNRSYRHTVRQKPAWFSPTSRPLRPGGPEGKQSWSDASVVSLPPPERSSAFESRQGLIDRGAASRNRLELHRWLQRERQT